MEEFTGIVQRGSQRASQLGYPTINLPLTNSAVSGVYTARVLFDDVHIPAAAFADPARGVLEAHLIDYTADLYDKEVTIKLYKKIRETVKFENDDALIAAMETDVAAVRKYFKEV